MSTTDSNVENSADSSSPMTSPKPKYWQTLEEWRQDPEFQKVAEQEFRSSPLAQGAGDDSDGQGGWARREFLKLMGASLALTSFGCIRRSATHIVPYVKRPMDVVEGIANEYASTYVDGSQVFGVVVRTREGRPIHVNSNKLHPNGGAMSARAHAHILSLYDPSRLNGPVRNLLNETKSNRDTVSIAFEKADAEIIKQLKKGKVAILSGSVISPSLKKVMGDFVRATNAKVYKWEAGQEEAYVRGQELSYGTAVAPRLRLDKAQFILAVNNDFLGTFLQPAEQTSDFAKSRKLNSNMSRLVVFESLYSLTGANADTRYRIRSSDSAALLMGVLYELLIKNKVSSYASDAAIVSIVKEYSGVEADLGLEPGTLAKVAQELQAHRGESLVLGGSDVASQVAANLLNSALGNDGRTLDHGVSPNLGFQGSSQDLAALIRDILAGDVKTLIVHGVNPAYAAPVKSGFVEALREVETAIYTGDRNDETGRYCDYVLPDHHPLEGWGDAEGQKGLYTVQQPTIRPLGNTRGFGDTLIAFGQGLGALTGYGSFHDVVKAQFAGAPGRDWVKILQDGFYLASSRNQDQSARGFRSSALSVAKKRSAPKADYELALYTSVGLKDGSLANVPWLQEFSDPVTKICWDNYLCVSPKTAREKKIKEGQIVKLTVGEKTISVPAHIQPGQDDHTLGLAVGYGRSAVGSVGNGVGVNAFELVGFEGGETRLSGLPATLATTSTVSKLASTQGHHTMMGRQIVVEATLDQYKKDPSANIHRHKVFSAWPQHKYEGYKWGMSIDLNVCTGCSACVIACQSENNVPTVGKKYVIQGRIMHWIRIDRYFVGDESSPDAVHMPVLCQHCDNAPCETVCPVAATVHGDEGTNDMIYNRCVGTRYCANNCPYKVRRFNWFNYKRMHPELHESPLHMALNPEVTVRERGVMEKCTFCTHKIKAVRTVAKLENRKIKDGEVTTACQDSCPTNAIVFGDLNDPQSAVSLALKDTRHYTLLEELNNRPAIQYASKIRNTDQLKGESHGSHGAKHAEGGH